MLNLHNVVFGLLFRQIENVVVRGWSSLPFDLIVNEPITTTHRSRLLYEQIFALVLPSIYLLSAMKGLTLVIIQQKSNTGWPSLELLEDTIKDTAFCQRCSDV